MTSVTVFRRVPTPIIGVCGLVPDRAFDAFEESLDWLETTGILVERLDPATEPSEVARFDEVVERLAREGERCLPIILVDGEVASTAVRPTRLQLARIVGRSRHEARLRLQRPEPPRRGQPARDQLQRLLDRATRPRSALRHHLEASFKRLAIPAKAAA